MFNSDLLQEHSAFPDQCQNYMLFIIRGISMDKKYDVINSEISRNSQK